MPEPLVSVVVATHDRPALLERLLESLEQQRLDRTCFEVIVVDDCSGSETAQMLCRRREGSELALRQVRFDAPRGPSSARNAGWRAAHARLVAFTDDDCVADPGWLAAALAAHREHPQSILQGRTIPDPEHRPGNELLVRTVSVESLGPQYQTCNIFYPRQVLERLGGFDESFGNRPAAEDTDLAWRAIESGVSAVFVEDALVKHAVLRLDARAMVAVATRWTAAMRVFADHPRARSMLYRGKFWNVWHYLMWRSAAALLGPAWLRRMVLTLHLLELRTRARAAGSGAHAVPFLIVHDLVECWAIARGAMRYRTLVL